jgi:predicted Rossmann-fold nucleotide-binding protein
MAKREIESIEELERFLDNAARDWADVALQGLDLTESALDTRLQSEHIAASTAFLGCTMSVLLRARATAAGAFVIPSKPGLKFEPFRGHIYSAIDLLSTYQRNNPNSYRQTKDWECYEVAMDEQTMRRRTDLGVIDTVLFRLHDLHMEDALEEYLKPDPVDRNTWKKAVAIMGGHSMARLEKWRDAEGNLTGDDSPYMQVALLGWKLARAGYTVVTGGGPGAMEAGNLGAWFASYPEAELRTAVRILERVQKLAPIAPGDKRWNSGEWLDPAFEVMEKYPRDTTSSQTESVGIPTWIYGHEPPNPFASHIAKYFENSFREEGLLAVATHGLVVAEGNAGTVQEIFQDAAQNYYKVYGEPAPMVLLGSRYWNPSGFKPVNPKAKPVWPLLQQLGSEKKFGHLIKLTDSIDEVVAFLSNPPAP